jgi:uncharacterized membrane protein
VPRVTTASLMIAVFLACAVEAVEATTIVLAAGTGRDWRSSLSGTAAALAALAVIVAALGPAVTALPLRALRLVVGALLLTFGLQWLRKAILRASGHKASHDEEQIFRTELAAARAAAGSDRRWSVPDWYAFTLAFKGVLLEGFEVAFIVVSFGGNQHDVPVAALSALAAVVLVAAAGAALRAPLSRVPENTMKFVVGVMLTGFGTFWGAQGAGASWPGSDAALPALVAAIAAASLALTAALRRRPAVPVAVPAAGPMAGPMAGDGGP